MPDSTSLSAWLDFISTFVWQIILVVLILIFRTELKTLLKRLSRLKTSYGEVTFQVEEENSVSPGGTAELHLNEINQEKHLTRDEIQSLVANSTFISEGEKITGQLLLFQTHKQRTWLVATDAQLFCILDYDKTRKSGKLIQWRLQLDQATPITVESAEKETNGRVNIGPRRRWLYSQSLHPDPEMLVQEIIDLISQDK